MTAWMFVTRWGNSLLLLPTASWIGVSLWAGGGRHIALRWAALFGAAVLLVLATKLAFLGWGIGSRALDFTGVSGHSTLSAAVLPMFAWWFMQNSDRTARMRAVLAMAAFAVIVGLSRVLLSAHSVSEVVAGLALGLLVVWAAVPRAPVLHNRFQFRWLLLGVVLAVGSISHVGDSDDAHSVVTSLALWLSGRDAPYTRDML
jgi:membrane-associated phospholipid phosphatase